MKRPSRSGLLAGLARLLGGGQPQPVLVPIPIPVEERRR
jgi:hypothetical protein